MNRSLAVLIVGIPVFVWVVVIGLTRVLDMSRTTRVVIIGVTTVVCVAALVSLGVCSSRRSN